MRTPRRPVRARRSTQFAAGLLMAGSHRKPSLASVFGKLPSAQFPTAAPGRRGVPALHEPDGRERCRSAAAPLHGDHSDFQGKTESLPQANPFRSTFSRGSYGTMREVLPRSAPPAHIAGHGRASRSLSQRAAPAPRAGCTWCLCNRLRGKLEVSAEVRSTSWGCAGSKCSFSLISKPLARERSKRRVRPPAASFSKRVSAAATEWGHTNRGRSVPRRHS